MRIRTKVIALAVALAGVFALSAGSAAAWRPYDYNGCELTVYVPLTTKSITIPTCENGPPL